MKSSFLLTLLIALTANVAHAQMTSRPSAGDLAPNKTTFDKFSDRLKISYFGVLTSPHFDDIEKGQWRNGAISPEFSGVGDKKNQDTWPASLWHQVSFNYNFGAKMNFVVNPRFLTPLAHAKDMDEPEDKGLIQLDDVLVGFQGVVYSSEDKKLNVWIRPGVRLPTSIVNRNGGSPGKGTLTNQVEVAHNITYDISKKWQLAYFGNFRHYVYEDNYGFARNRIYISPYIQYTINDTTRYLAYYNNILQTDSRGTTDHSPLYKDVWQEVQTGISKDVTKKLTVFPYLGVFINDKPITDKSAYVGAWIIYTIK